MDTQTLDRILAGDYTFDGAGDVLIDKEQWVAGVDYPGIRTTSAIVDDLRIRVYGDAAVVTGRAVYRGWSKKSGLRGKAERVRPGDPPYSTRREPRRPPSFGGYRIGPSSGNIGLAAEIRRARMAQECVRRGVCYHDPREIATQPRWHGACADSDT